MTTAPAFRPWRYLCLQSLLLLSLLSIIAVYWQASDTSIEYAAREGGLIDLASAIGYFLCSALMLFLGGAYVIKHHYPLIISVVLLGLRELDVDKHVSTLGLFKSRNFSLVSCFATREINHANRHLTDNLARCSLDCQVPSATTKKRIKV